MLELINAERTKAGLGTVELGDNIAAQLHAEASLENCFSSHWGMDGLKPYMRYSLAGGYQSNGENGHGLDYCIKSRDNYRPLASITQEIDDAMEGWMASPGHRDNIMDKWHKKVNIGLAWDRYNLFAYQHFEGDYVEYDQLPSIEDGILALSGIVKNGADFNGDRDLSIQIYYDRLVHQLTRGQIARTYCYDLNHPIAALREPLADGWYYPTDNFKDAYNPCPSPYDVSPDAAAPRSHDEAHRFWQDAYRSSQAQEYVAITVPWITASLWRAAGSYFIVEVSLEDLLSTYGDGVYTVVLWGPIDGESTVISEYSMFVGITPPPIYDPDNYN